MNGSATCPATTVEQFINGMISSRLMSSAEAQQSVSKVPADRRRDSRTLAQELVKQQTVTSFQARRLLQGQFKGLVLGSCVMQEELGAGGMGVVFKALHRGLNKSVAVKVLPPDVTANAAAVKRFRREALASGRLSHPNLVAALDTGEEQGVHFLVLEFIDGSDLSRHVKKHGPMPMPQALDCILQAAAGLACAHAAGIVHRDVKPHNLILNGRGNVKVLDLGLARLDTHGESLGDGSTTASLTKTGSFMGSCDYIAPEQAMNIKTADHRADVYSLGCTLHFLLTGKPPYTGETGMDKIFAHREQPIPTLVGVPRAVQAVFRKMVAKRPEERFATMNEAIAALQACQGKKPRRRLAPLLFATGGLGIAAAVLVAIFMTSGPAAPIPETRPQAVVPTERFTPPTVVAGLPLPADQIEQPRFQWKMGPAGSTAPGGITYHDRTVRPTTDKRVVEVQERLRQVMPPAQPPPPPAKQGNPR